MFIIARIFDEMPQLRVNLGHVYLFLFSHGIQVARVDITWNGRRFWRGGKGGEGDGRRIGFWERWEEEEVWINTGMARDRCRVYGVVVMRRHECRCSDDDYDEYDDDLNRVDDDTDEGDGNDNGRKHKMPSGLWLFSIFPSWWFVPLPLWSRLLFCHSAHASWHVCSDDHFA